MQTLEALTAAENIQQERLVSLSSLMRNLITMGAGTVIAAILNVALIFLIPRLVSVEDFGYWRLFMLYTGYVGFLHFGLVDGALLRWAGQQFGNIRVEILPSLRFLFWQHIAIIVPATIILAIVLRPDLRTVAVGVLLFALLANVITLLQFGLQSAHIFLPVSISTAGPLALFVLLVTAAETVRVPDFQILIVLYLISWAVALVYLAFRSKLFSRVLSTPSSLSLGKNHIRLGWPVLLANTGLNVIQTVDRLVVSWGATIRDFAQYSLAASSTITVVLAVVVAIYRVFFPHLAALDRDEQKRIYRAASRFLILSWILLLPYYFILDAFIRRVLPKYVASLPIAGILLLSTIFLAEILILHTSFAYLNGKQRDFLFYTIGALAFAFVIALSAVYGTHSLQLVACGEVISAAIWWIFNEFQLRHLTGQTSRDLQKTLTLFCAGSLVYGASIAAVHSCIGRIGFYYGCITALLLFAFRTDLRFLLGVVAHGRRQFGI